MWGILLNFNPSPPKKMMQTDKEWKKKKLYIYCPEYDEDWIMWIVANSYKEAKAFVIKENWADYERWKLVKTMFLHIRKDIDVSDLPYWEVDTDIWLQRWIYDHEYN